MSVQIAGEIGGKVLHHKHRQLRPRLHMDTEELHDVGVVESAEQLAFLPEPPQHVGFLSGGGVFVEQAVDLLSDALESTEIVL